MLSEVLDVFADFSYGDFGMFPHNVGKDLRPCSSSVTADLTLEQALLTHPDWRFRAIAEFNVKGIPA